MKNTNTNTNTKESVYAFIDSQNLNLGTQRVGWHLDWRKFLKYLQTKQGVTKAYLFIGYLSENEAMYEQLKALGYEIVYKPVVENTSDKDDKQDYGEELLKLTRPPVKGNVDAELVLYAMKEMPNYKKAILVTGDGDFYSLAKYLNDKKRLACIMTPNWQYSSLLKEFSDKIVRIDLMRRSLEYRHRFYKRTKGGHGKPTKTKA